MRVARWFPVAVVSLSLIASAGGTLKAVGSSGGGGTLVISGEWARSYAAASLDPRVVYNPSEATLLDCCLDRTLLAYNGLDPEHGGTELRPDLTVALPDVSRDGLTWTFHLREGLRYSPPLESTAIRAADIARAIARIAQGEGARKCGSQYAGYYSIIQGFDAFAHGGASSITGLQYPNDRTLEVTLTHPAADFGALMTLAATAPIPAVAAGGALGSASGHDGKSQPGHSSLCYGHYLVSSGPYMFEREAGIDFSLPADKQTPAWTAGDATVRLVRNPSWVPSSDPLRPAIPDVIELRILWPRDNCVACANAALKRADGWVVDGTADIDYTGPTDATASRYSSNPDLSGRLRRVDSGFVAYAMMNVAAPPFDDVHVRRAVALALWSKRDQVAGAMSGGPYWRPIDHLIPDPYEGDLLVGYHPSVWPTVGAARREIAKSRYDRNRDGRCDSSCIVVANEQPGDQRAANRDRRILAPLRSIGLQPAVHVSEQPACDRTSRSSICPGYVFGADFPDAEGVFEPMFSAASVANFSMLGARPHDVTSRGYKPTKIASIDGRIGECRDLVGPFGILCWSELDRFVMEHLMPAVPIAEPEFTWVFSTYVDMQSLEFGFSGLPTFDRMVVTRL